MRHTGVPLWNQQGVVEGVVKLRCNVDVVCVLMMYYIDYEYGGLSPPLCTIS